MNISKSVKKLILSSVSLAAAMAIPASAISLPNETFLSLTPGVATPTTCVSGSCFSMTLVTGFPVWTAIEPGTDGGIILGKNQLSGGQQTGPDSTTNTTSGQMTKAFYYFSNYGTFGTAPMTGTVSGNATTGAASNIFDSASCTGAACNAVTKLGTWNVAWGGKAISMGSAGGCLSTKCTSAQTSGTFVAQWTVNPNNTYVLDYNQVVPDAESDFGGVPFGLHLTGTIVGPVGPPEISGFWPPNGTAYTGVFIFGKNFLVPPGAPQNPVVCFNNGTLCQPIVQPLGPDLLFTLQPVGTVPGKITVTTTKGTATSQSDYNRPTPSGLVLNGIWPGTARVGEFVIVFGSGFNTTPNATKAYVNGVLSSFVQTVDQTMLFFLVPPGATTGLVTITANAQTATAGPLVVVP